MTTVKMCRNDTRNNILDHTRAIGVAMNQRNLLIGLRLIELEVLLITSCSK